MLLERLGALLYGPEWQSPLARALDVNLRTMQRWAAGIHQPPERLWGDIAALLRERRIEIDAALAELSRT